MQYICEYKKNKLRLFLFILFSFSYQIYAQEFSFRQLDDYIHYSSEEVFDIIQDNQGFVWFATPYGVIRFNGNDSQIYTTEDGLISNSIIKLYKDFKGRIWFISHRKGLSYFDKGTIKSHYLNPRINSIIFPGIIEDMSIDSAGTIYLSRNIGGILKIFTDGKIEELNSLSGNHVNLNIVNTYKDEFLLDFKENKHYSLSYEVQSIGRNYSVQWKGVIEEYFVRKHFCRINQDEFFLSIGNNIIYVKNNKVLAQKNFAFEITDITIDAQKRVWIATLYDGVYLFSDFYLQNLQMHLLGSQSISRIYFDLDNNIWVSTLGNGVQFLSCTAFEVFKPDENETFNILDFEIDGNQVFLTNYEHQLWALNLENKRFKLLFENSNPQLNLKDIEIINNEIYLLGSHFYHLNKLGKLMGSNFSSGRKLAVSPLGDVYFLFSNSIVKRDKKGIEKRIKLVNPQLTPTCIQFTNDSSFYLGTNYGLYEYKGKCVENLSFKFSQLNDYIIDIKKYKSKIYIAVKGVGLAILNKDSLRIIDTQLGLSSNFINSISVENDSIVWTANNNGLNKICFKKNAEVLLEHFTTQCGLPANNIRKVMWKDSLLWLGTSNGIVRLKNTKITRKKQNAKIIIDSVLLNNEKLKDYSNIELIENEDNLEFYFQKIDYSKKKEIAIYYQLNNGVLRRVSNNLLVLPNLDKSIQKIHFYTNSDTEKQLFFTVNLVVVERFVDSLYFQVTILFLFLSLLIVVTKLAVSYVRKRAVSRELYLRNKQKALITHINPTFIQLAVETTRYLLSKNQKNKVDVFLQSFNALLKSILFHASFNTIKLEDELKMVKNYLEMAKLRYQNSLLVDFLPENENLSGSVNIPPMLLLAVVDAYIDEIEPIYVNQMSIKLSQAKEYCTITISFKIFTTNLTKSIISRDKMMFIDKRISIINKLFRSKIILNFELREDRIEHWLCETRSFIIPLNLTNRKAKKKGVLRLFI